MNTKLLAICCMFIAGALAGGKHRDRSDDTGELITPGVPFPDPVTDRDDVVDDSRPQKKTTEATVIEGDPNKDYYDPNEPCPGCKGQKKRKVQLNFRIKLKSKNKNRNVNKIRISGFDGGVSASDNWKWTTGTTGSTTTTGTTTTTQSTTSTTTAGGVVPQAPAADANVPTFMQSARSGSLRDTIIKTSQLSGLSAGRIAGNAGAQKTVNQIQRNVKAAPTANQIVANPRPAANKPALKPVVGQVAKLRGPSSQLGAARAQAPKARADNKATGSKSAKKLVDLRGKAAQL